MEFLLPELGLIMDGRVHILSSGWRRISCIIFKFKHVSKKIFTIKQIYQDYFTRRLQKNFPASKINESSKLFTSFTARHHAKARAYHLDTRARIQAALLK